MAAKPKPAQNQSDEELLDLRFANASPAKRWYLRNRRWILGLISVTGFLLTWQAAVDVFGVNPLLLSSPSRIFRAAVKIFSDSQIYGDIFVSLSEFIVGMVMAIVLGIAIGILAGWNETINHMLDPFMSALYATPRIALLPLLVLWFGIGIWSKIAVVFLGAFFPIAVNTMTGIRISDRNLIKMAHAFGSDDVHLFKTVILPGAVPFILTGLRLGIGRGLVGVVTGELFGATAGVGYRLTVYGQLFQISEMFVGIMIIAAMGIISVEMVSALERRFEKWRPQYQRR